MSMPPEPQKGTVLNHLSSTVSRPVDTKECLYKRKQSLQQPYSLPKACDYKSAIKDCASPPVYLQSFPFL